MKTIPIAAAALIAAATPVLPEAMDVTDIAGRTVTVEGPVDHMILGEGRLLYAVAALDRANPFKRVVGWRDDLIKNDPQTYALYNKLFPQAGDIPTFGGIKDGTFDVEQAIMLDPDVVIMNLESKGATEEAGLDRKLAAVGIPLIYIDFRDAPMRNTAPSLEILGKILGKEDVAQQLNEFRDEQIALVTDRLAQANPDKPLVFIERAAGYSDECCMSIGNENFGLMVEMAGGRNMAADIIPGTFGTVNGEQVVASNPGVVIVTGANWEATAPGGAWVGVGPGADMDEARQKLSALMTRPAFTGVKAVHDNDVHAVWHQFYNSLYQFVVIQQMAKWLHPEEFADVDPQATFKELHDRFLPVPYTEGYFANRLTIIIVSSRMRPTKTPRLPALSSPSRNAVSAHALRALSGSVIAAAVIGPNAAGKSSLFKRIAGLARGPGTVKLSGGKGDRTAICYMPQDTAANAVLSVYESVVLAAKQGASWAVSDTDLHRIDATLAALRIEDIAFRNLGELSGGQRQLVALAHALVRQPEVLLMDEPTSALDLARQIEVLTLMRRLARERGMAVLIALHDINHALHHCRNVIVIAGGA